VPTSSHQECEGHELVAEFGPLIGGHDLRRALGFRSRGAFRQALERGHVPVPVFQIEGRRGKFAFTADVVVWLKQMRATAPTVPSENDSVAK